MKVDLTRREIRTIWLALHVWKETIDAGHNPPENELTKPEIESLQESLEEAEDGAWGEEFDAGMNPIP
jgi:hypothetical protein